MKRNSLILSTVFGLSILFSTPKIEAINKKFIALGGAIILGLICLRIKKNKTHGCIKVTMPENVNSDFRYNKSNYRLGNFRLCMSQNGSICQNCSNPIQDISKDDPYANM